MDVDQLQTAALLWLGFSEEQQADETQPDVQAAQLVAPAVWSWVDTLPSIERTPDPDDPDDTVWGDKTFLGAVMLAARLIRRRNSPHGIESFTVEGAAYVRRTDPDIAQLLHMGNHAKPRVG